MKILCSLLLSISLSLTSFGIDFSQLVSILFNNEEITEVYYNDELVWKANEPFYVIENGFLVEGNYVSASRIGTHLHSCVNKDYGYLGHSADDSLPHNAGATVTFKTNGAKTLRVKGEASEWSYNGVKLNYSQINIIVNGVTVISENHVPVLDKEYDISEYEEVTAKYICIEDYSDKTNVGAWITEIYCE